MNAHSPDATSNVMLLKALAAALRQLKQVAFLKHQSCPLDPSGYCMHAAHEAVHASLASLLGGLHFRCAYVDAAACLRSAHTPAPAVADFQAC